MHALARTASPAPSPPASRSWNCLVEAWRTKQTADADLDAPHRGIRCAPVEAIREDALAKRPALEAPGLVPGIVRWAATRRALRFGEAPGLVPGIVRLLGCGGRLA